MPIFAGGSFWNSKETSPRHTSHFKRVTEIDPTDAAAWYWLGCTIPTRATRSKTPKERLKAIKEKSKQEIKFLGKALELNPYSDAGGLSDSRWRRDS